MGLIPAVTIRILPIYPARRAAEMNWLGWCSPRWTAPRNLPPHFYAGLLAVVFQHYPQIVQGFRQVDSLHLRGAGALFQFERRNLVEGFHQRAQRLEIFARSEEHTSELQSLRHL